MVARPQAGSGVRVAELVATLSYAADLGLGQPMAHCMRQTVIALRLGKLAGASDRELEATYYLGLMMNVYCHADAAEQARWFGDDISLKGDGFEMLDMSTARMISFIVRRVSSHGSGGARARRLAAFPVAGMKQVTAFLTTHSTLGSQFAKQIGLDDTVSVAIQQAYEQWDGKGYPHHLRGHQICLPARLVQLASPVEIFSRRKDTAAAVAIARRHRGRQFDPAVVDLFCEHAADLLDGLDQASDWDAILDTEPPLSRRVAGAGLDEVLEAMADLVDLKSPYLAGHSRGVANLAGEAARVSGQPADAVSTLRRAGLIHDLGRLGVSNAIWDKPGPLTQAESERVRLHPYLTDRMLARVSVLGPSREIAARHHERLDGSGYPRSLTAASLTPSDRLLAAADAACPARAARRAHRTRGRGARPARPRPLDQGDRPAAGGIAEDCGQPRRTHLRQARRLQPCRGDAVRHAARPDGCLRARPLTAVPSRAQAPCIACMFFVTAASTARSSPAGLIWRNSLPVVAEGVWPGGA